MTKSSKAILTIIETIIVLLYLFNINLNFLIVLITKINIFLFLKRKTSIVSALFSILVLSIPTSFINILGGPYGILPISWFNICFILVFFYFFSKIHQLKFDSLSLIALMLSISLFVSVLISYDIIQALKDYLNFLIMFFLIFIRTQRLDSKILEESFIIVGYSLFIALLLQIYFFVAYGKLLGKIDLYNMRISFGVTFSDYSFLGLFFAAISGLSFVRGKKIDFFIFSLASLLTSARTGVLALLISLILYSLFMEKKSIKLLSKNLLIILFITMFFLNVFKFIREEDITNPSGRIEGYIVGIRYFFNKPIFGIGLGTETYKNFTGYSIPHNILIQMLTQTGIVSTVLFIILIYKVTYMTYKKKSKFFLPLIISIVGSFFIPDIMNSRFFPIFLFVALNEEYKVRKQYYE